MGQQLVEAVHGRDTDERAPKVEAWVRVLGNDYDSKTLIEEIDAKHDQLEGAAGSLRTIEEEASDFARSIVNQGKMIMQALKKGTMTEEEAKLLAERTHLQSKHAKAMAKLLRAQRQQLDITMRDMDRLAKTVKHLIAEYPRNHQPN